MRTHLCNENLLHTFLLIISQCEYNNKLDWHIKQDIDASVNSKSIPLPTSNLQAVEEFVSPKGGTLEDSNHYTFLGNCPCLFWICFPPPYWSSTSTYFYQLSWRLSTCHWNPVIFHFLWKLLFYLHHLRKPT